jgi:hypothetical protein
LFHRVLGEDKAGYQARGNSGCSAKGDHGLDSSEGCSLPTLGLSAGIRIFDPALPVIEKSFRTFIIPAKGKDYFQGLFGFLFLIMIPR